MKLCIMFLSVFVVTVSVVEAGTDIDRPVSCSRHFKGRSVMPLLFQTHNLLAINYMVVTELDNTVVSIVFCDFVELVKKLKKQNGNFPVQLNPDFEENS
jgi:hypothetical protein